MAEEKDVEFMSPHQDIKTISINGTIFSVNDTNIGYAKAPIIDLNVFCFPNKK